jgi:hypothetical protein
MDFFLINDIYIYKLYQFSSIKYNKILILNTFVVDNYI